MNSGKRVSARMPALFVGHGNPMNALGANAFAEGWGAMVRGLPRPAAVLCVSAHWDTPGLRVGGSPEPPTIHDFYGFPEELYRVRYPCPGAPDLAREVAGAISLAEVTLDGKRGLDHGTWAVMKWMYPEADVPVFQMSLDTSRPASFHYQLGRQVASLREEGVLIVGSGNMVHNLAVMDMTAGAAPYGWAAEFDHLLKDLIREEEHQRLVDYHHLGPAAPWAVPTPEHYLPLLVVLGASREGESLAFFNEAIDLRSVSMTSVKIG